MVVAGNDEVVDQPRRLLHGTVLARLLHEPLCLQHCVIIFLTDLATTTKQAVSSHKSTYLTLLSRAQEKFQLINDK